MIQTYPHEQKRIETDFRLLKVTYKSYGSHMQTEQN